MFLEAQRGKFSRQIQGSGHKKDVFCHFYIKEKGQEAGQSSISLLDGILDKYCQTSNSTTTQTKPPHNLSRVRHDNDYAHTHHHRPPTTQTQSPPYLSCSLQNFDQHGRFLGSFLTMEDKLR